MRKILLYMSVIGFFLASCQKDNYYQDSGTHKAEFDGTIMQYLDSKAKRPIDLFDTLVQVIRYAGLEEVLDKERVTFFAVPDPSIIRSMRSLNSYLYLTGQDTVKSFKAVKPEVWKYYLSQYIVKGDYGLIDFPQVDTLALYAFPGQLYQSYNTKEPINVGVVYHDLENEGGIKIPYKGQRQILISYIPDFAEPKKGWVNAFISSSNIKPLNGRVHVINYNKHGFGFDAYRFVQMAIEKGIDYQASDK
ncbi:hypothetical protein SAMN05660841_01138 [Sphingobacterium nematocida]|uniref:Fasciclin domain-containing protein n=1 Tax=Sphingobacterium nematocida TaxID=1513896 RepID=A0A1T5C5K9_9SPHI|nr:hypothetical protein [Sphingobacterium nematocida]SKB54656.1 hypothetical protein SAMN05660841_01138 [Sphingobacterium nematocida]